MAATDESSERVAGRRALGKAHQLLGRWSILIACVPALLLVWTLIDVLSSRLFFPMDLEWIEGGQLLHAHRVLHGQELYTAPNQGFTPYSYPPGHTVILAAVGAIFGLDFWVGRLVSWVAMGGVMALLAREVYREFRPVGFAGVWAILAVGAMAAAFPLTAGWYDFIRNDELALVLALAAAVLTFDAGPMSRLRFFGSVGVMAAAVFTKQTTVFYLCWIMVFQLIRNPRRGFALGVALAIVGAVITALLEWGTNGRYLYYTIWLLADQVVHKQMYAQAVRTWLEFAPYLPFLPVLVVVLAWFRLLSGRALFWFGMLLVALPASMLPYAKQGGYLNNLLPVAVLAGPVALTLLGSLLRAMPRSSSFGRALPILLAACSAWYLQERQFSPDKFRITEKRQQAAVRLFETLKGLGDSILMPHHPFVAVKVGSRIEQFHEMPWVDAWLAGVKGLDLRPFIKKTKPEYVVVTGMEIPLFYESIADDYVLHERIPEDQLVPPIAGFPSYPRDILVRRQISAKQTCIFDFERSYAGWEITGEAFGHGPRAAVSKNVAIVGRQGRRLASSFSPSQGDASTGTLRSPTFAISRPLTTVLVGGGRGPNLGVELWIDGNVVARAAGQGVDFLQPITWDTARFIGKNAEIRVFDDDRAGHILVDAVCQDG